MSGYLSVRADVDRSTGNDSKVWIFFFWQWLPASQNPNFLSLMITNQFLLCVSKQLYLYLSLWVSKVNLIEIEQLCLTIFEICNTKWQYPTVIVPSFLSGNVLWKWMCLRWIESISSSDHASFLNSPFLVSMIIVTFAFIMAYVCTFVTPSL